MSSSRVPGLWYALMTAGGLAFGLIGDRRPFGQDVLAHPLIVFFALAVAGLMALRIVTGQPVPQLVSERTLAAGCILAAAAYLAGNWLSAQFS